MKKLTGNGRSGISRFREKKILSILNEYDNGDDLTVLEFCKMHKIHKATFYNWRKRYANKEQYKSKPKGFVPVELTTPSYPSISDTSSLFAEVNGIRLYHFVSADYLKALLP
jgi:Transposase